MNKRSKAHRVKRKNEKMVEEDRVPSSWVRKLRYGNTRTSVPKTHLLSYNSKYRKYSMDRLSYGKPTVIGEGERLRVGRYCSIAKDVTIFLRSNHDHECVTTYPFHKMLEGLPPIPNLPKKKGGVSIGHDVWLCRGCTILDGVTIGNGAVVSTGAVVSSNVAPYSIVGGVPAKLIKKRFDEDIIKDLLEIEWWYLPDSVIVSLVPLLLSNKVKELIKKVREYRLKKE
jgi:acetyltransferase-like isoleucine patch superfamily enzyme